MVKKNCFLLIQIIILLILFTQDICSQGCDKIKFSEFTLKTAQNVKSLSELYLQTGDKQVEIILNEIKDIVPKGEKLWTELMKNKVVDGVYIIDSVEFINDMAFKKNLWLLWHQKNFKIVEEARAIFKKHPLLKRITISKDGIIVFIEKDKRGLMLSYYVNYIEKADNSSEIVDIKKNSINIKTKEGFYFYFSSSYELEILKEGHRFFISDEDNLIIEIVGVKYDKDKYE